MKYKIAVLDDYQNAALESADWGAPAVQNDVDCAKAALALVPDAIPTK
jgi:hypothetical protein